MAQVSKAYGGKYMNSADVPRQGIRTTIEEVVEEEVGKGADQKTKLVMYLKGQDKPMVLNKTNGTALAEIYGDETDDWTGKRVVLKVGKTLFEGKKVDSIMVDEDATKAAARGVESKRPAPVVTQAEADEEDEVPF